MKQLVDMKNATATFVIPTQNAADYFDRGATMTPAELAAYLERYATAVCARVVELGFADVCEWEFDSNSLGGTYWINEADTETDDLQLVAERIFSNQNF